MDDRCQAWIELASPGPHAALILVDDRRGPLCDQCLADLEAFVHVYTEGVQRSSSAMASQLEAAFKTFDPAGTGVLAQSELREALRRMASAPLDEVALPRSSRD